MENLFTEECLVWYIKREEEYLKKFLELIKSTMEKDWEGAKKLKEELTKKVTNKEPENGFDLDDYLGEIGYEISEREQKLYQTFIVSVGMFIEQAMKEFCDYLFKKNKTLFSYKDLRGNGLKKLLNYMEKVLGESLPNNVDTKNKLSTLIKIRNAIVHNNGKIAKEEKQIIIKIPLLKLDFEDRIELNFDYAKTAIDLYVKICEEIAKKHYNTPLS